VTILPGLALCEHVYPQLDLGSNSMNHLCNLNTKTCGCGFTALTKFPCLCMAILVKAIPHAQLLPLVDEQDKTPFWQKHTPSTLLRACCPNPTYGVTGRRH